jgi:hypothetical protein
MRQCSRRFRHAFEMKSFRHQGTKAQKKKIGT